MPQDGTGGACFLCFAPGAGFGGFRKRKGRIVRKEIVGIGLPGDGMAGAGENGFAAVHLPDIP